MARELQASHRANKNAVRHHLSSAKKFARYKSSTVPEGGWTHENYVGDARLRYRRDALFVHRSAVTNKLRTLTPHLNKLMVGQVERILGMVESTYTRLYGTPLDSLKAEYVGLVEVPSHAPLWAHAIQAEMGAAADLEVLLLMKPAIQSVSDDVFEKVNVLLGAKPTRQQVFALNARVNSIAKKVTVINETTRKKLASVVAQGIKENLTVFETIEMVRSKMPTIASNRVATIVRTEMGRASDEATKHAMKMSGIVTHFDVIGCERIEPNIPTFQGTPTCNIEGVPIQYEYDLEFHINHTGCIVSGVFRKTDGTVQQGVGLGNGEELGDPDFI
tara:strand:+ start:9103 stop:10098 length:996 start_codon:yes stop_codon:yes gene_type:complete